MPTKRKRPAIKTTTSTTTSRRTDIESDVRPALDRHLPGIAALFDPLSADPREPGDYKVRRVVDSLYALVVQDLADGARRGADELELANLAGSWSDIVRRVVGSLEEFPG